MRQYGGVSLSDKPIDDRAPWEGGPPILLPKPPHVYDLTTERYVGLHPYCEPGPRVKDYNPDPHPICDPCDCEVTRICKIGCGVLNRIFCFMGTRYAEMDKYGNVRLNMDFWSVYSEPTGRNLVPDVLYNQPGHSFYKLS